jgi:hypothetical protein
LAAGAAPSAPCSTFSLPSSSVSLLFNCWL